MTKERESTNEKLNISSKKEVEYISRVKIKKMFALTSSLHGSAFVIAHRTNKNFLFSHCYFIFPIYS